MKTIKTILKISIVLILYAGCYIAENDFDYAMSPIGVLLVSVGAALIVVLYNIEKVKANK